jgi:pimeloyl-ACP methyl ester carboxylesterase
MKTGAWYGAVMFAWILAAAVAPAAGAADEDVSGHWEGTIELPGTELGIKVDLANEGGTWSGTVDIPMQGAKGLALSDVSVEGEKVKFSISGVPGNPTFDGTFQYGQIQGTFSQGGGQFPFHLGRGTSAEPKRPQTPKPPFPYTSEDVTYHNGDVVLAGTLTIPKGDGPYPAVLLISGSGSQDRDETIFEHKPFWVIADGLSRHGIAVLRVDDRGVGGSKGDVAHATSEDFAKDVEAGVAFLKSRPEIRKNAIGLAGHSEGGIIAPMVAAEDPDVAFIIMLAGPAVPGADVLAAQNELLARAEGATKAEAKERAEDNRKLTGLVVAGADSAQIAAMVRKVIEDQAKSMTPGEQEKLKKNMDSLVQAQTKSLMSPWMHFFLTYDPRPTLAKVKVPVLALYGEKDLQVPPDQSVSELEKALEKAGNKDVTVRVYPNLNHLFQTAKTGAISEYYTNEETFNDAPLEKMESWINERFGAK